MRLINLTHLYKATGYSLAGLRRAWQNEQAFRHEAMLLPVVVLLLAIFRPGALWCGLLLAAWLLVMAVELLNSAVEESINIGAPGYDERAKHGKDMASAAVFILLVLNGLLWLCMLVSIA